MKATVALLLSLLLAGTPFSRPAVAVLCGDAAACKSCCAQNAGCCSAPSESQNSRQPAAPAPASTQNEWQAVATVLHLLTAPETPAQKSFTPVSSAPPGATAVPIYQRDCCYLV